MGQRARGRGAGDACRGAGEADFRQGAALQALAGRQCRRRTHRRPRQGPARRRARAKRAGARGHRAPEAQGAYAGRAGARQGDAGNRGQQERQRDDPGGRGARRRKPARRPHHLATGRRRLVDTPTHPDPRMKRRVSIDHCRRRRICLNSANWKTATGRCNASHRQ